MRDYLAGLMVLDKIKAHVRRNKKIYVVGSYVAVAGVTFIITKKIVTPKWTGCGINTASFTFGDKNRLKDCTFNIFQQHRQGGSSNMVQCVETGEKFVSQRAASIGKGVSETNLSAHLNKEKPLANGLHFERIGQVT